MRGNQTVRANESFQTASLADAFVFQLPVSLELIQLLQTVMLTDSHFLQTSQVILFVAISDTVVSGALLEAEGTENQVYWCFHRVRTLGSEA